jgi:hypothetical protein
VLWGTCPVLEGALGWYSAYGQVLLTTLVMVVVANLASVAAGREPLRPRRALCWGALLAGHLLAFGPYTLLLGFLGLGRVYPGPISLAAAAIVAGVIGLGWLRGGAVTRRRLVGVGLLLLALDGMTAVGRASVFAFYHEPVLTPALAPRYQYLPLEFLTCRWSSSRSCCALRSPRCGPGAGRRVAPCTPPPSSGCSPARSSCCSGRFPSTTTTGSGQRPSA